MSDLKEIQSLLPEAVSKRLIEEAEFIKGTFGLDAAQAGIVERALFMGATVMKEAADGL